MLRDSWRLIILIKHKQNDQILHSLPYAFRWHLFVVFLFSIRPNPFKKGGYSDIISVQKYRGYMLQFFFHTAWLKFILSHKTSMCMLITTMQYGKFEVIYSAEEVNVCFSKQRHRMRMVSQQGLLQLLR